MKSLRLPLAAAGVVALLSFCWSQPSTPTPLMADDEQKPAESLAARGRAVFRVSLVAQKTLPSIVSVRTIRKIEAPRMTQMEDPFDSFGGSPLDDLFGDLRQRMREQQGQGSEGIAAGEGSGFIIDPDGIIMTNAHVVRGADEVYVTLDDGKEYKATDIKADDFADVAVVRIKADRKLPAVAL